MNMRMKILTLMLCAVMVFPSAQADAKKISSDAAASKKARSLVKGGTVTEIDRDREGTMTVYEVTVVKGKKKYEVTYNAANGKLIEYSWERIGYRPSRGRYVSKKKVKKLALKQVKKAKVTKLFLDVSDDGDDEYEVDMKKGQKKYTLDYDAFSGKLVSYKWKLIVKKNSSSNKFIGTSKAKAIAKKKVPAGAVFEKVKLDKEHGRYVYEIEMRKGQMEYEMTIDATTGKILEFEKDYDD